ncbi:MAG: Phosphoribosylglycinamide formyltransferase [Desulfotomaculum sp. 46_296]|nr:MAG: Phosphoribosylglycinamide formyltransferase [Desulfotomaculum sp. 46_296]HAU32472.1 phosphoribosylglycinamide formyltransferase [Desulfotomaculum sp.]
MVLKIGVLVSGRGSNLQAIMDACDEGKIPAQVVVVISDVGDAPALERARLKGIDAVHVDYHGFNGKTEYEQVVAGILKDHHVELVCLAGYMRIVGRSLLDAFQNRIINIHPALLPSFPGLDAQRQAVEHGVRFSGCTVHFIDEGVDSGPIILQAVVPVHQSDTPEILAQRILAEEHRIYPEAIGLFARGKLKIEGRKVMLG